MGALPKRRISKTRGRKRRTSYKVEEAGLSLCPHCHKPKHPHRVCPHCGYYGDKEVIFIEKEVE